MPEQAGFSAQRNRIDSVLTQEHLLAVDVGLYTGLALFNRNAQLLWYRSHHPAGAPQLKRLVAKQLRTPPRPTHIYYEGGGPLAAIWEKEAVALSLMPVQVQAQQWRQRLFHARQHSSSAVAKREALLMAHKTIHTLGGKKPTSLRHDTAEAILIGVYALLELGWLERLPDDKG